MFHMNFFVCVCVHACASVCKISSVMVTNVPITDYMSVTETSFVCLFSALEEG